MDDLCSNPAKFFCDKSLNPYVEIDQKNRDAFNEIDVKSTFDDRVLDYISQKVNGKVENCKNLSDKKFSICIRKRLSLRCSQLSVVDLPGCVKIQNHVISEKLYTESRKTKATALFEKARADILVFLEKKRKSLNRSKQENTPSKIEDMVKTIKKVKLEFESSSNDPTAILYSAVFEGKTVSPEGSILSVDNSPETLYSTFLHELSHSIDAGSFSKTEALFEGNPFQKELQCLQREDSVGAHKTDVQCLKNIEQKYKQTNKKTSETANYFVSLVTTNPHSNYAMSDLGADRKFCSKSQIDEAFADWVQTEVSTETDKAISQYSSDETSFIKTQENGDRVIDLRKRLSLFPRL